MDGAQLPLMNYSKEQCCQLSHHRFNLREVVTPNAQNGPFIKAGRLPSQRLGWALVLWIKRSDGDPTVPQWTCHPSMKEHP